MNFNKNQYNCLYILLTLVILYCIVSPPNLIEGNSKSNNKMIKNLQSAKHNIKKQLLSEIKSYDSPSALKTNANKLVQGFQYSDAIDKSIALLKNPDGSSFGGNFFGSGSGSGDSGDNGDNGNNGDNGSDSWFGSEDSKGKGKGKHHKSDSWFGSGDDDDDDNGNGNGKHHKHHKSDWF